jgi:hypothetical protein
MSTEIKKEIQLEIAHVLFIDIVGYSKLSINDQHAAVDELNHVVRASERRSDTGVGNTDYPGDPGTPSYSNHLSAKGDTGQA